MKKVTAIFCFLLFSFCAYADVKPANIFTSHMVLQRDKPMRFWGTASPGEKITVTLGNNSKTVKAMKSGEWELTLPALPAGGPYVLTFKGKNSISFDDILVGEVWLCSGQSNMEWPLSASNNARKEIAEANYPQIRHFLVAKATSLQPQKEIKSAEWQVCSPETAGGFTAVGYFFARELYSKLNIPIGLVHSSWGGTHVETWISGPSFFGDPEFADLKSKLPESFDGIIAERQKKTEELVQRVQGSLPDAATAAAFKNTGINDGDWKTMNVPGLWESKGLNDVDGEIWFRRSFAVPADIALKNVTISLGKIDDKDSTFVNGVFVGSVNAYNEARVYSIPSGALKVGNNVVAVKIMDTGGGGGMYGEPGEFFVDYGVTKFPLSGDWKYRLGKVYDNGGGMNPNAYPTLLYNAMIHPIIRFPIAGTIWYQGESNAGRAKQYETSFPLMINDWRKQWKDSFPFYFVQLTHWQAGGGTSQNGGSNWAELREAQEKTLRVANTGMAVIIDIGQSDDIHPRNKQDVGKRLALQALAKTYRVNVNPEGPRFTSVNYQGNKAVIQFANVGSGWDVKNKYGFINGFEVAGADKKFHYAKAWVENGNVVVFADGVPDPIAVRYAWADDPSDLNLFNKEGLPAIPFRTDKWPGKTEGGKFSF
jgi:sialate O-acetylesterase